MDVVGLAWPTKVQARDYHLLPGYVSPRFDHIARVNYDDNGTARNGRADNLPQDVKVKFFSLDTLPGVTLDPVTGEVEVASPLPAAAPGKPWPQQYWVHCDVTQAGNKIDTVGVKLWIHSELDRVWMTPEKLTVRQNQNGVRFSLLARFKDGTMGDLSNWSPMAPPAATDRTFVRHSASPFGTPQPLVFWTATGSGISIPDTATGFLKCTDPAAANVTVSALVNLVPVPGSQLLTAKAFGGKPWSTQTQLDLVTSASSFDTMADRRNVLFLPDGFDDVGRPQFEELVRQAVSRLTTRKMTRPFDFLKDKFNFFMAWVPSRNSDIMVAAELVQQPYSGPPPPPSVTLNDVVMYDGHMAGTRVLENERDTAFHHSMGDRPMGEGESDPSAPTFHPLRMNDDDFETFLKGVTSKPGVQGRKTEGEIYWALKDPNPPAGTPPVKHSSEPLVAVLCRNAHAGGVNAGRGTTGKTLRITLENRKLMYARSNPSNNGFDLWTVLLDPAKALLATWLTIAHEFGHSFHLLDEYGGSTDSIPEADRIQIFHSANNQAIQHFPGNQLSGLKIKWNWPRIEKAAVFTAFVKQGSQFECTLAADYARVTDKRDRFATGDLVRLRTRDILSNVKFSSFMTVVSAPPKSLTLKLKLAPNAPALAPPFLPWTGEGVIFKTAQTANKDRDIIHPDVAARITSTRNPLNALSTEAQGRTCSGGTGKSGVSRATNFLNGKAPKPPSFSSWIIGAYESGKAYNCGVYHPSGVCVMRETQFTATSGDEQAYQFCHVCRYAMVDELNPLMHGAIDRDYAPRYPK